MELPEPLVFDGPGEPMRVREPDAVVADVEPGSIADQLGLEPGWRLLRINGVPPRDLIDYQLLTATDSLELTVGRGDGDVEVVAFDKDEHEDLGLAFESELFVPLRTCNNGCLFCFVLQAPPGLRPTVYVKDDDYRLSFLHGHFTTLTNLTEPHFRRIVHQNLSPMHVSVHASEPELRRLLLDNRKADVGWAYLERLVAAGIECHTQIVACPGVNDAAHLDRTIADLAALGDGVLSIGVVPVGLTRFQAHPLMRAMTPAEAAATIDQIDRWRGELARPGNQFVYAADELYLAAGRELPGDAYYDEYVQFENGIGTVRSLLDELSELGDALPARVEPRTVRVVTGEYGALFLGGLIDRLNAVDGLTVELVPVANELFGGNVRCAGLLCGRDILAACEPLPRVDLTVLPGRAVNDDGVLLDDLSPDDLAARLGGEVAVADSFAELAACCGAAPIADVEWV